MAEKKTVKERAEAVRSRAGKHGNGFMDFIRTQGVVGLAVGLAIGTAAGDTVKKLVDGFINPIIQFIVKEAVDSGIEDIIFVTGRGKSSGGSRFIFWRCSTSGKHYCGDNTG